MIYCRITRYQAALESIIALVQSVWMFYCFGLVTSDIIAGRSVRPTVVNHQEWKSSAYTVVTRARIIDDRQFQVLEIRTFREQGPASKLVCQIGYLFI